MVPVAPVMPMMMRTVVSRLSSLVSSLLSQVGKPDAPLPYRHNQRPRDLSPETRYHRHLVFKRQTEGSVLCTSCGVLVGVNDETCYNCGRKNPSLWGYAPVLRSLGTDLGFVPFLTGSCVVLYGL